MLDVLTVDRLEMMVLIDNLTDSLSTNPKNVTAEWTGLMTRGRMRMISGQNICCAHHGLSLLISAHVGDRKRTMLFDAGPEGATFLRNAKIFGVDFAEIGTFVLSHGHWGHAGGLVVAVEAAARVTNTREPQVVGEGAFFVSGEIPRLTKYELGLPGQVRRSADGQSWEPDPLLMDERFISGHVKDKGQFVFSACSHAGLLNVLNHARSNFPTCRFTASWAGCTSRAARSGSFRRLSGTCSRSISSSSPRATARAGGR